MEHLWEPEGSAAEKFMLMMHDRLLVLEEQACVLRQEVVEQKHDVALLMKENVKTYNASTNRFCDGSWIDWCVWEPVDLLMVRHTDRPCRFMTLSHLAAVVKMPHYHSDLAKTHQELEVPVQRNSEKYNKITMPVDVNVGQFFAMLHDFYSDAITNGDMCMHGTFGEINLVEIRTALGVIRESRTITTNDIMCLRDTYWSGTCCTTPGHRCSSKLCGGDYKKGTVAVSFYKLSLVTVGERLVVRLV